MGKFLFWVGLLMVTTVTHSHEATPTYNRINLSVSAQQEVDNDILVAVLFAQEEGKSAARLAKDVNRKISAAVTKAKQADGIKVQTLDYTTSPTYRKQAVSGWRVRQSIRLESKDPATLSGLIGDLQKELGVSRINYALSPETRAAIEESLIADAIGRFNNRAKLIQTQMGRQNHKLVQMNINSGGNSPQPRYQMAMMEKSRSAAPQLEAGTQTVTINIQGTIELQ